LLPILVGDRGPGGLLALRISEAEVCKSSGYFNDGFPAKRHKINDNFRKTRLKMYFLDLILRDSKIIANHRNFKPTAKIRIWLEV